MKMVADMDQWGQYSSCQIVTSTLATTDTLPYYIKVPVQVETGGSSEEHPANSHHCCQC